MLGKIANHFRTTMTDGPGDTVNIRRGFCKGHRVDFVKSDAKAAAGTIGKGLKSFFTSKLPQAGGKILDAAKWCAVGDAGNLDPKKAADAEQMKNILNQATMSGF